jgi:hypothetical protein
MGSMRVEIERSRGQIGTGRWKAAQKDWSYAMPEKALTIEEKQAKLLDAQLETQLIMLDRQKKENLLYVETEEDKQRKREQAQFTAKANIEAQARRERNCKHQAGVQHSNPTGKGVGGSCLTASRIFFSWNWLIQCVWCGMKNMTPTPTRKNRKLLEVKIRGVRRLETAEERDARVKLYEEDLARHKALLEDAQGTGLPPMMGPAWDFTDEDGTPVIPMIR